MKKRQADDEQKPRSAQTAAMTKEQRTARREPICLTLQLDGSVNAVTRDISATGLYFETESQPRVGCLIQIEILLDGADDPMKFKAQGQIVRIESLGSRTGVGVRLLDSRLEAI